MKKVLILAYDFPPFVSVGGLRPYSWLKYFKEMGLEPVVVTRQWQNKYGDFRDYIDSSESPKTIIEESELGTVHRTAYKPNLSNRLLLKHGVGKYKLLRKIITAVYEWSQYFLPIGTKINLYLEAKRYLKGNKVDYIIATGDPFVLFHYASKLSKQNNIPWYADYRDLWSQDVGLEHNKIEKRRASFLEKKITPGAKMIFTVSENLKEKLSEYFNEKKIAVVPNGYDLEAIQNAQGIKQDNSIFSIGFAGSIYPWHPLDLFYKEINKFIQADSTRKVQLNFYGVSEVKERKENLQKKYPSVAEITFFHKRLNNEALLMKLSENNLLLLFNDYHLVGTKIYDYLGLKRKILFCFTEDQVAEELKKQSFKESGRLKVKDDQENIIITTQSGVVVKDTNDLQIELRDLFTTFKENGSVECNSISIEQYSRKIQVRNMVEILEQESNG